MKLVGLVSSYQEGPLTLAAVRNLEPVCDHVVCFDGPVDNADASGEPSLFPRENDSLTVKHGSWLTDAEKRTDLLGWAREMYPGEVWGLWNDGDELLMFGENLRDEIRRNAESAAESAEVGGFPLPLVELASGDVSLCFGKCVRLDLIAAYLISSSWLVLESGEEKGLPNQPVWSWRHGPLWQIDDNGTPHPRCRPVLAGEPHLLHRSQTRSPKREVERQHEAEARAWKSQ